MAKRKPAKTDEKDEAKETTGTSVVGFGTFSETPAGTFTASRRLYLTKDGKVVGEDDPDRHELLVNEGGTLNAKRARELGLDKEPEAAEGADDEAQAE